MAKTSIIIPTYNQDWNYLEAAIISAASQIVDWDQGVQVVVVDDGSENKVSAFFHGTVSRFNEQFFKRFENGKELELTLVEHEKNQGIAAGLNSGIQASKGEYIQWLSSDDLLVSSRSRRQIEFMEENDAAISYCAWEDGIPTSHMTWPAIDYPTDKRFRDRLNQHCFINACTVIWRRDVFDEVGLFDPDFVYTQDYEFLLRCAQKYHFHALNLPLVRRRTHPGQLTNKLVEDERRQQKEKEFDMLHQKYGTLKKVWTPHVA